MYICVLGCKLLLILPFDRDGKEHLLDKWLSERCVLKPVYLAKIPHLAK